MGHVKLNGASESIQLSTPSPRRATARRVDRRKGKGPKNFFPMAVCKGAARREDRVSVDLDLGLLCCYK